MPPFIYRHFSFSAKAAALAAIKEAERQAALNVPTINAVIGEPLKNISIFTGQPDPVALPEDQYPAWLAKEVNRAERLDSGRFQRLGTLPTRTELRLLNKARIREMNEENSA